VQSNDVQETFLCVNYLLLVQKPPGTDAGNWSNSHIQQSVRSRKFGRENVQIKFCWFDFRFSRDACGESSAISKFPRDMGNKHSRVIVSNSLLFIGRLGYRFIDLNHKQLPHSNCNFSNQRFTTPWNSKRFVSKILRISDITP